MSDGPASEGPPRFPAADIAIDVALVTRLVAAQRPEFAHLEVRELDQGFDNALYRLGPDLVVRLPRRREAVPLLEHELRWLPELAPGLPIPVPRPVHEGRPAEGFDRPWAIAPYFEGVPADVEDPEPRAAAEDLGTFLRVLHRRAPDGAPANPLRGVGLDRRQSDFEARLAGVAERPEAPGLRRAFEAGLEAEVHRGAAQWLHGDLHPGNLIVRDGRVVAVIDFGDLCAGDPASDVAVAWLMFAEADRTVFFDAYGAGGDLLARARAWAALFSVMLFGLGADGRAGFRRVGERAMHHVVS